MNIKLFRHCGMVLCAFAVFVLLFSAHVHAAETEQMETVMQFHSVFTNLTPGEEYVLFVTKEGTDDPLNPENLLYMDQETANENGSVSFSYALSSFEQAAVSLYGTGSESAKELTWELSDDGILTIYGSGEMDSFDSLQPAPWHDRRGEVRAAIVKDRMTKIGAHAFEGCASLTNILFEGDAPVFEEDCFASLKATVSYPGNNPTWTEEVMQDCGGEITWISDEELQILLQPEDYTGKVGETAVFRVKVTGSGLSYQWQCQTAAGGEWISFDGEGSTTEKLKVELTKDREDMRFRCLVTDGTGKQAVSEYAVLHVIKLQIPVTGIALDQEEVSLTLEEGKNTVRLNVIYSPSDADTGKEITWTSSDQNVAIVKDGVITAAGTGRATVTAATEAGLSASCIVTVDKADSSGGNGEEEGNKQEQEDPVKPSDGNGQGDGNKQYQETENHENNKKLPAAGTMLTDSKTKAVYVVVEQGSTVWYKKPANKKVTKVSVPSTVTLSGITYNVTGISAKAFSGCTKLKTAAIGKNVVSIGTRAFYKCKKLTKAAIPVSVARIEKEVFYGCSGLKTITIKTERLTSKTVGVKAFKGIHAKAVIKVPKKKKTVYTKLLKAKGVGKRVRIK